MTNWAYMKAWAEANPKVKDWLYGKFTEDEHRADPAYHLRNACTALNVEPEAFLSFLDGRPSELYKKTKQYLQTQSTKYFDKARLEKFAIQSFVRFHSDRPGKFMFDVQLTNLGRKYIRPRWGLKELQLILEHIHMKYRPLLKLGCYCGLGRKEMCYLNEHFKEVKAVPNVPEAMCLDGVPIRKRKGLKRWTCILPRAEFEDYKRHAPIITFGKGTLIGVDDITINVQHACDQAEIRVVGTNSHVLRSIFKTVGLSQPEPNISEDILDMNMGHTDIMNYDRRSQDIEGRAKAMLPLWEYMRHGPEGVTKEELKSEFEKWQTNFFSRLHDLGVNVLNKGDVIAVAATREEVLERDQEIARLKRQLAQKK